MNMTANDGKNTYMKKIISHQTDTQVALRESELSERSSFTSGMIQ